MDYCKLNLIGLQQVVAQDTGRSLKDINDDTPLASLRGEDRRNTILFHCQVRFGERIAAPEGITRFGDLREKYGIPAEPERNLTDFTS